MNRLLLILLLPLALAPACAPEPAAEHHVLVNRNLVLLTDTTQWSPGQLTDYRDSLTKVGYRVLVSGYPGESSAALAARLPWLLQPGVDVFLYDERLAGQAGLDSLRVYLTRVSSPALIQELKQ